MTNLAQKLYWNNIRFDHHAKWWKDAFCMKRDYLISVGDRDGYIEVRNGDWIDPQKCKKNFHILGRCGIDLRLVKKIDFSFLGNKIHLIDGSILYWDHWAITAYPN